MNSNGYKYVSILRIPSEFFVKDALYSLSSMNGDLARGMGVIETITLTLPYFLFLTLNLF